MRIFIASSSDLENERKDLKILCYDNNCQPILWEDLDQSITTVDFQERINKDELTNSDIVIFMVKSRLGQYTQEEFEESYKLLGTVINKIYVYFFKINKNDIDKRELYKILNLQNFLDEEKKVYKEIEDFKDLENHFLKQKQFFTTNENKRKEEVKKSLTVPVKINSIAKIAILYCCPINSNYNNYLSLDKILKYFEKYNASFKFLTLNYDNLYSLNDFDSIFIFTLTDNNSIIIEDEYLTPLNLKFTELDNLIADYENKFFHIFSLSCNTNTFISKYFNIVAFSDDHTKEFNAFMHKYYNKKLKKGKTSIDKNITPTPSEFNISTDLKSFVGRETDLRNIIRDILDIEGTNILYTVLGSGGIGKTTLVKKIVNDLSRRGKFSDGFSFIDCQHLKDLLDIEQRIKIVFEMTNALDFKEQLAYIKNKDRLIVLDNFETLLHLKEEIEIENIKKFLLFITNYASIIITSREKLNEDYERVYPLSHLTLDEAEILYLSINTLKIADTDRKYFRDDILDSFLNRNPLAIKLVANLRLNIIDLGAELSKDFFITTGKSEEDSIKNIFHHESDIHIEKSKSLFYSISLSFEKLVEKHKLVIELLSLFPDGIDKKNFIAFYNSEQQKHSSHKIDYTDINKLEDKTLLIVNNEFIKLQSIIGRFAEYKFSQYLDSEKIEFYTLALNYNDFLMYKKIQEKSKINYSLAVNLFIKNKNNFIKSFDYLNELEMTKEIAEYIHLVIHYLSANTTHDEKVLKSIEKLIQSNKKESCTKLIKACYYELLYFYGFFEKSFSKIEKDYPFDSLFDMDLTNNKIHRKIFRNITNVYEMEGCEYQITEKTFPNINGTASIFMWTNLFHIGEYKLTKELYLKKGFSKSTMEYANFDFELNFNILDLDSLLKYRNGLDKNQLLEYLQTSYIVIKNNNNDLSIEDIENLVVSNSFTDGLKVLMLAIKDKENTSKKKFEYAIDRLYHIRYYHVEAILFYSKYLKEMKDFDYNKWYQKGKELAVQYQYRFLLHQFINLENDTTEEYDEKKYLLASNIDYSDLTKKYNIKINK